MEGWVGERVRVSLCLDGVLYGVCICVKRCQAAILLNHLAYSNMFCNDLEHPGFVRQFHEDPAASLVIRQPGALLTGSVRIKEGFLSFRAT